MKKNKIFSGYTLIEMLIVIAIIGIMMSFLLVSIQGTAKTARDSRRKTDLELIRSALVKYYDNHKIYPTTLDPLQTESFLSLIPSDPISSHQYVYTKLSNSTYDLCASLEDNSGGGGSGANCWGSVGSCDSLCQFSATANATVYSNCTPSTCGGSGCWGIGGSCDAGCNKTTMSSSNVFSVCNSSACGICGGSWKKPDGSACGGNNSNVYYNVYSGTNCSGSVVGFIGGSGAACSSDGSGGCYSVGNPCVSGLSSTWPSSSCTNTTVTGCAKVTCTWSSGSACNSYAISGSSSTKYQASGVCDTSNGTGTCYKITGSGTTGYTGNGACGSSGCAGQGTYYSNSDFTACSWIPNSTNTYSVSGSTSKIIGSGTCSGTGSGNCYRMTGGTVYYTGNGACGSSGCPQATYYSGSSPCVFYSGSACNYHVKNP